QYQRGRSDEAHWREVAHSVIRRLLHHARVRRMPHGLKPKRPSAGICSPGEPTSARMPLLEYQNYLAPVPTFIRFGAPKRHAMRLFAPGLDRGFELVITVDVAGPLAAVDLVEDRQLRVEPLGELGVARIGRFVSL